jgi:hypothetical protein
MENESITCNKLIKENEELKRALALSLNKPLIQNYSN